MQAKRTAFLLSVIALGMAALTSCTRDRNEITFVPADKVQLGKKIFFDKNLSNPAGQSCASCHSPEAGFSDPNHGITAQGAAAGLFSNRNCPSVSYTLFTPALHFDTRDSTYVGGFFLDGHAGSLQQQARFPFLNKLEMSNTDAAMVISKLRRAGYFDLYRQVYGEVTDIDKAFVNMTDALASFERSDEVNPFSSKFDAYVAGKVKLSGQELHGLQLFRDPRKGNCAACHPSTADEGSGKILFTDFTYDNIGVPKNPANPFYTIPVSYNPLGAAAVDRGLGGFLNNPDHDGRFKVPSLRNVALTAPYFHNGFFKTLEEVVHFYNRRDVESFPPAEIPGNVNKEEMGNLKLTAQEEKDITAFLNTLTDGYH